MPGPDVLRGEVWMVDLNPTLGREQSGIRPALIVSADPMNRGPSELVVALPITGTIRSIPAHVRVDPPSGGLTTPSAILCDQIRTISRRRLVRRMGMLDDGTLTLVGDRLRLILVL